MNRPCSTDCTYCQVAERFFFRPVDSFIPIDGCDKVVRGLEAATEFARTLGQPVAIMDIRTFHTVRVVGAGA